MARPISIFMLYNSFKTVPKEYSEAARIEGCGQLRFLVSILVPLSKPILAALGILSFVASWNRYMWPLIVARKTAMRTAPIGLRMFISQTEGSSFGVMMAGAVMVIFPAILVFILAQKQFIKAVTRRSIKG
ncbi:MAG: carbohydrate ABC transporter permease [Halanaerobiaceae bacterium]